MAGLPVHLGDAQDFHLLLWSRLSGVSVTVQLVENWTNSQWSCDTPLTQIFLTKEVVMPTVSSTILISPLVPL